jgi:hypothetical protein
MDVTPRVIAKGDEGRKSAPGWTHEEHGKMQGAISATVNPGASGD